MKESLTQIKVEYKTIEESEKVNEVFDRQIEKLANEYGLELQGTGFNMKTQVRDLKFKGLFEK